jgi:alkylation response protein AidB-like acyl-CoA dehydrogenase
MDVIEAVTKLDPAAGWSLLVASGIAARVLSALPDDAARELLGSESFPLFAGSLKPTGSARRVDGGLEVSGRWAWASGVRHADYAVAPAFFEDQPGVAWVVAPLNTVEIHDAWFSLGLKGTGSTEFSLDKAFIPQRFASLTGKPVRGGALYRLGYGSAAHEHGIFAYALGRAALDAAVAAAEEKVRGYAVGKGIAHREIFQSAVAEGELRLRSSRLLMADTATRLFDSAVEAEAPIALQAEARAASAFCTNEAIEVTTQIFRILGGDSVMQGSPMERIWRDLMTAQAHLFVSQSSYEALGRLRLGLSEEAPLG